MHSTGSLLSSNTMHGISPPAIFLRRFIAALIVIVFALQAGCASQIQKPVPNIPKQDRPGKFAVVTTSDAPVINVEEISQLKGAGLGTAGGAAGGAAAGAAICAPYLVLAIMCPLCAPAAVGVLGTCVGVGATAGAAIGGVAGATSGATAEDAEKIKADETSLMATFKVSSIQQLLRGQVEAKLNTHEANRVLVLAENLQVAPAGSDHGPSTASAVYAIGDSFGRVPEPAEKKRVIPAVNHYRPYADLGADTVLEVAFTEVGYKGGLFAVLTMKADARLVDTSNGEELFSSSYTWQGKRLKAGELSNLSAESILKEVQIGYQAMATHIDENIFLLFPFPDRKLKSGFYGLILSSPRPKMGIFSPVPIDRLQPTFAWQAFPRAIDTKRVPEQMSRVKDVRYDLVIADEHNDFPGEIIYRREGLTENSHQLEFALSPGEHYYWTVRARFMLDGRQRLTEWSSVAQHNLFNTTNIPNRGSFQFITPKKKAEQE